MLKPKTSEIWYADGHHSVSTANHRSLDGFLVSLGSCSETAKNGITGINPIVGAILKTTTSCTLNTLANLEGFNERRNNGKLAGSQLLDKLKQNVHLNTEGKITDTLDIVCHSMGFAYALGMIDILREKLPFGRLYIIAPENASSGSINLSEWQDVWQYGTDERIDLHLQDGIAPQTPVGNIGLKRAFIPDNVPQGFLESHSIVNYGWIFTIISGGKGYVKPRE